MKKLEFNHTVFDEEEVVRLSQCIDKIERLTFNYCNLTPRGISSLAKHINNRSTPVRIACGYCYEIVFKFFNVFLMNFSYVLDFSIVT